MAEKVFVPRQNESQWDSYWQKTNYQREMKLCQTDGLLPIFKRYLSKAQSIIEAGCGAGKWVIYLGKRGYDIVGVDNNELGLKKLKQFYPQAKTKLADVLKLPYNTNSFDTYISLGVVEHFENGPQQALAEAYRVTKPGGLAVIEVPYDNPLRRARHLLGKLKVWRRWPKNMEFYEYHYTKTELGNFVRQAGFKVEKFFPKDDLDPRLSLGLWLDWPKLRVKIDNPDFRLTKRGRQIKKILELLKWRWLYSACVVCIARK